MIYQTEPALVFLYNSTYLQPVVLELDFELGGINRLVHEDLMPSPFMNDVNTC